MADYFAQRIWDHFATEILPVNMIAERTAEQKDDIFSKLARFLMEMSNSVPLTEVSSILIYCTCMVILYIYIYIQYWLLDIIIIIMTHAKSCDAYI